MPLSLEVQLSQTAWSSRYDQVVAIVPSGLVRQQEVARAIGRAVERLRPDVLLIRYSLEPDWTGDPSIFFRVLLSDEAAQPGHLRDVAQRVAMNLEEEVQPENFGLHFYVNFRSKSEQDQLKEPAWA